MPKTGIKVLESGTLKFSRASEFNDPFEQQPFLIGVADDATVQQQVDQESEPLLRNLWKESSDPGIRDLPFEVLSQMVSLVRP
jgi:hypothetical protein